MPPKKKAKQDADSIGPYSSALGITKSALLGGEHIVTSGPVTNGVVIELARLSRVMHTSPTTVMQWLGQIGVSSDSTDTLIKKLCERREYLRRQKKQEEIKQLETEIFCISNIVASPAPVVATTQEHQATSESTDTNSSNNSTNKKINNLLTYQINKKRKSLETMTNQLDTLRADCKETAAAAGHYLKKNVDKRDQRAQLTREERDSLKTKYDRATVEIEEMKGEIRRSAVVNTELGIKIKEFENLHKHLQEANEEKRRLKKRISYLENKLLNSRDDDDNSCTRCSQLEDLKLEVERLQLENDELREGRCPTETRSRENRKVFNDSVRKCVLDLAKCEVATRKMEGVIKAVAQHIFHHSFKDEDLPHANTCQSIIDEGHYLAKKLIGEKLKGADRWGLHKDGTTRRKCKLLDTSVVLDTGEAVSLGFSQVASETGKAITEDSLSKLHEVVTAEESADVLKKLRYTMSDRASNEKKSNKLLADHLEETLQASNPKVQHFFCLAHVLLGFHSYSITALKEFQKTLSEGGKLGRDKHKGFKFYQVDQAASRLCCDISNLFAPVGNHFGLRDIWEAFCSENNKKSHIRNYKDNRFNGLFHASASTTYHLEDLRRIVRAVKDPNKKVQAVGKDLEDDQLMSILAALGIIYVKVTEPFFALVTSKKTTYLKTGPVIRQLREDLELCSNEASLLLTNTHLPAFSSHDCKSEFKSILQQKQTEVTMEALKIISKALCSTMDKQLESFLTTVETEEDIAATSFAPATNLLCERNFGDLDASQHRRPGATLHHHTSVHLLKRMNVSGWLSSMPQQQSQAAWKCARKQAPLLRKKHQADVKAAKMKAMHRLEEPSKKKTPRQKSVKKAVGVLSRRARKQKAAATLDDLPLTNPEMSIIVGQWAAVAYQESWYPGIIQQELESNTVRINFSEWSLNLEDFKWPRGNDVQVVDKSFILATGLEVFTPNGRVWKARNHVDIQKAYSNFSAKYF